MIEKIIMQIADESGNTVELIESDLKIQSKLDSTIADYFSRIIFAQQGIADDEIRIAEKFNLAHELKLYLKEMKKNA